MKRSFLICIFVMVSVFSLNGCAKKPAETPDEYQVYIVDPPINNYAIQEHKPLPAATCKPGKNISIMACRGEYEPASFVIETDKNLENVLVTIGQLTTGSGAVIPSGAVDVRIVKSCWVRISDFPGRMNMVLLHDPNLLVIEHEKQDEPHSEGMSFTRTPIDTADLQPADVNSRQQFWLTVHVPDDATTGIYNGDISITAGNVPTQTLSLELIVPGFDLAKPNFQYSIYHATVPPSDLMRLNDFKNMVAHGCMNPNIYNAGVDLEADGKTLNFTDFAKLLSLREEAGMEATGPLYIVNGTPVHAGDGAGASMAQVTAWVKEIVAWAQKRGYSDVYFMGNDEATGQRLIAQRPTWEAVHAGGGKVFIANYGSFFPHVGDLVDLAVITHPSGNPIDTANTKAESPESYLTEMSTFQWIKDPISWILDPTTHNKFNPPDYPKLISDVHKNGFKIYTYMDCLAGGYGGIPDVQRRLRGLGLYKANLDGTMTWSYNGPSGFAHLNPAAGPVKWTNFHSFVLRGAEAPFDTPQWEGYREGYDDARYLATLQNAITQCRTTGRRLGFITGVEAWLDNLATDVDLNTWRRQMAIETEKLLGLKATVTPLEKQK